MKKLKNYPQNKFLDKKIFPLLKIAVVPILGTILSVILGAIYMVSHKDTAPASSNASAIVTEPTDCSGTTGESYMTISVAMGNPWPASQHPDKNLGVRGWEPSTNIPGDLHMIYYNGDPDSGAPDLYSIFNPRRKVIFYSAYQIYDWDWSSGGRGTKGPLLQGPPPASYPVTLLGIYTEPGEKIHTPKSVYDLGQGAGGAVIYAEERRLTIGYQTDNFITGGYTAHFEDFCVDKNLLAIWNSIDNYDTTLPGLRPNQAFGYADKSQVLVAIRDGGMFMDPRAERDWWQNGPTIESPVPPDYTGWMDPNFTPQATQTDNPVASPTQALPTSPGNSCQSSSANLNGDDFLDIRDFQVFASLYRSNNLMCDFNEDGVVDIFDFVKFRDDYRKCV